MITKSDLNWWFELEPQLDWQFATTYAVGAPHEYVVAGKTPGLTQEDTARAAHVIRTFGTPMKFYGQTRIYLVTPANWKHWDMQAGTINDDTVTLINRGRVEHVYGVQNMPLTDSGRLTEHDALATTWDRDHGMTTDEQDATASLIRSTFSDRLGRTLDVGCGTGVTLDLGVVEGIRYVGIDPSTAMLNALVAKHPVLAGVHPMTYGEAESNRVLSGTLFDTVLSLGGSASFLSPAEIELMRDRAKRTVLLMHFAPEHVQSAIELDPDLALDSLRAATRLAKSQTRIGRFVASVLAGSDRITDA
jgi:SAM-dependent methyltransferase